MIHEANAGLEATIDCASQPDVRPNGVQAVSLCRWSALHDAYQYLIRARAALDGQTSKQNHLWPCFCAFQSSIFS